MSAVQGGAGTAVAARSTSNGESSDQATIEGPLHKKGMLGWSTYHFVLLGGVIRFYKDETCAKLKGELRLRPDSSMGNVDKADRPWAFKLSVDGKSLVIAADNAAERDSWKNAIEDSVFQLCEADRELDSIPSTGSCQENSGSASAFNGSPAGEHNEDRRDHNHPHRERESYRITTVGNTEFNLPVRFTDLHQVGRGAYGCVCSARLLHSTAASNRVAVKKVKDMFSDLHDAKRIVREIRILRTTEHPNVVGLREVLVSPPDRPAFSDVFIVMDHMDTSLHRIIYSQQTLSDAHRKFIMYQIFCGLQYLHARGIVHRDMKPSNVLVNSNCQVKLCDFGLSRLVNDKARDSKTVMTEYVVTRWYRAPEVMLASGHYSGAVDVWGAGCIFAEMVLHRPMFKGKNYVEQLKRIFEVIGRPAEDELDFVTKKRARQFVSELPATRRKRFAELFPVEEDTDMEGSGDGQRDEATTAPISGTGPNTAATAVPLHHHGLGLLEAIFVVNPSHRIRVTEAVAHPYMREFHEPSLDNVHNTKTDNIVMDDIELSELSRSNLRTIVHHDIAQLHAGQLGHAARDEDVAVPASLLPRVHTQADEQRVHHVKLVRQQSLERKQALEQQRATAEASHSTLKPTDLIKRSSGRGAIGAAAHDHGPARVKATAPTDAAQSHAKKTTQTTKPATAAASTTRTMTSAAPGAGDGRSDTTTSSSGDKNRNKNRGEEAAVDSKASIPEHKAHGDDKGTHRDGARSDDDDNHERGSDGNDSSGGTSGGEGEGAETTLADASDNVSNPLHDTTPSNSARRDESRDEDAPPEDAPFRTAGHAALLSHVEQAPTCANGTPNDRVSTASTAETGPVRCDPTPPPDSTPSVLLDCTRPSSRGSHRSYTDRERTWEMISEDSDDDDDSMLNDTPSTHQRVSQREWERAHQPRVHMDRVKRRGTSEGGYVCSPLSAGSSPPLSARKRSSGPSASRVAPAGRPPTQDSPSATTAEKSDDSGSNHATPEAKSTSSQPSFIQSHFGKNKIAPMP